MDEERQAGNKEEEDAEQYKQYFRTRGVVICGGAGSRVALTNVKEEGASEKYTGWKVVEKEEESTAPQTKDSTRQESAKGNKKGKRMWELRLRRTIIEGRDLAEETVTDSRKRKRCEGQRIEDSDRILIGSEIELAVPRGERRKMARRSSRDG